MNELILQTKRVTIPLLKLMYLTYRVRRRKNVTGFSRKMTDEEVLETNRQLKELKINIQL